MNKLLTTTSLTAAVLLAGPALGQNERDEMEVETTRNYNSNASTYDETNGSDWFGPQGGEWEITLAGSGSNDKDFETGSFNIDVDASLYFSELLSAGVRQNVGYVDTTTGGDAWNAATSVFGQMHFGDTPLRPFIGVSVGYLYGDGVNETFYGGPEAGLRYYVKPEAFLFGRMSYQFFFESGDEIEDQFDDGRFLYTIGVGFTF